ncbi:MAG: IMP dehydrogenase, partial [Dehalococcoidia bacterium]
MKYSEYKKMRYAYGFEEIALVPGDITINPDQTDISLVIDRLSFPIPILASAMDGVVDVKFAIAMGKLGGLAVLNLEGLQTRYADPDEVLAEIADATPEKVTQSLQRVYSEPIKENLIGDRIKAIKDAGVVCAV